MKKHFKNLLLIFFELFFNFFLASALIIFSIHETLPNIDQITQIKRNAYVKIYDTNGTLIGQYGDLQEKLVKAQHLPKHLIHAITSAEDKNFFKHHGFDFFAILRSLFLNLVSNKLVSGASSITQQLAKNFLINEEIVSTYDKTILRKIKELLLAVKIERKYSKYQILTLYLNRCYFGGGCYGIFSGALHHFGKKPNELNLYESAALMGLLKAPSKLNGHVDSWKNRTQKILKLMLKRGYITKAQYDNFQYFKFENKTRNNQVGYYTDYVVSQIPPELKDRDLIIISTINLKAQNLAQEAMKKVEEVSPNWQATQGAFVMLDKSGAIKAMIGGFNYHDSKFNRAANAKRSTGSFFKYYIYAQAIEQGLNIEGYIYDNPIKIGAWEPSNYLHKTRGKVLIRYAFGQSVNSSAVLLLTACGIENVIKMTYKLGYKHKIQPYPSIALGGMNASILDVAATMVPVINSGYAINTYCIQEIRDANTNKVLYKHVPEYKKALNNRTIWYLWSLLKETTKPYGSARSLGLLQDKIIGGKTGSSNEYKDLIFVGATSDYVVGAWFGRDDFKPMQNQAGQHLGVMMCRFFLEKMPESTKEIEVDINFAPNSLSYEDILLKNSGS